ncbi:MAG TPA: trehalose-6-phosphate synthase, partial [Acidimicrobiales bacterium]|nr:trehalose-6-phosphate synthase [Acidimicrobiales bacterium]
MVPYVGHPDVIIVSNRGPVSFDRDDSGEVVATRGGGGLVSSLAPMVEGTGATWLAAAMTDDDRSKAAEGTSDVDGFRLRLIDIAPDTYRAGYDTISNSTLWFLHHGLWDLPRRPRFDRRWHEAWHGYRAFNDQIATAVADEAPEGGIVLVQDYHLALLGSMLAEARPDLRTVHFSHTPFCSPDELRILPEAVAHELMVGLASATARGFHTERWAERFRACAQMVLGTEPTTFVSPLAPDRSDLERVADSDDSKREATSIEQLVVDRKMILRVDRIELSKNIHR